MLLNQARRGRLNSHQKTELDKFRQDGNFEKQGKKPFNLVIIPTKKFFDDYERNKYKITKLRHVETYLLKTEK